MNNLNFSDFQAVDNTNRRSANAKKRTQNFELRYRNFLSKKNGAEAIDSFFAISDAKFDELGLDTRAGRQLVGPDGTTYIAIVDEENGTFWKQSEMKGEKKTKGRKFKSTVIAEALDAAGVIAKDDLGKDQKMKLNVIAENVTVGSGDKAFTAYAVLSLSKVEPVEGEENEEDEEEEETTENAASETATAPSENVASNPQTESEEDF